MCVHTYIVSSRTQVKQVKFTLVQTNFVKHIQTNKWLYGVHFLTNFSYVISVKCTCLSTSYICFKLFIKASSVGFSLFSLHLYTKNFACKRIKTKPSSVVFFPSCLKRISVELNENLAQLKLLSFKHISISFFKHWHQTWLQKAGLRVMLWDSHWNLKKKTVDFEQVGCRRVS